MADGEAERFWSKVDRRGPDECWWWLAYRDDDGYGRFGRGGTGRTTAAHRIAYEFAVGPIAPGLLLHHLCHNRGCVNPAHLDPVTPEVNQQGKVHPFPRPTRVLKSQPTVAERLWAKVAVGPEDECWPWTAPLGDGRAAGILEVDGRTVFAHRLAYELTVGPIPPGVRLRHRCDTLSCCNPAHLLVSVEARWWAKVTKGGPVECWLWTGALTHDGYGRFRHDGHQTMAHRYGYELAVGSIPDGLQLDHLCRNRACVNPAHLEPVTCGENLRRGDTWTVSANGAKTHCPKGHPYDADNTYVSPGGGRFCRACGRSATAAYLARKRDTTT